MPPAAMQIEYGFATDPGLDPHKRVNEDACGHAETRLGQLYVLCDGMGGHTGGKLASELALRTVIEHVGSAPRGSDPRAVLVAGIERAARAVYELGGPADNPNRPGSTCVALLLHGGLAEIAHVGDSRAYFIRGKQIYRITRDHSFVQEMLDSGVISEQDAIGHPDANKITRALGMTPEVDVEARQEPMEVYDGDVFVLASDGLTDLARNDDILVTVQSFVRNPGGPTTASTELVALANRRGGHDNITVQVVRVVSAGSRLAKTRVQEPNVALTTAPLGPLIAATIEEPPAAVAAASHHTPAAPTTIQDAPPVPTTIQDAPPVPTTIQDAPAVPATIQDGPPVNATIEASPMPLTGGAGGTLVQDPFEQTQPGNLAFEPVDLGQRPVPRAPLEPPPQSALVYLVLVMAAVMGLLIALLVWVVFFR